MGQAVDDRRVIVIGSGPAGAMAALTLLQEGIPVTMLESGQTMPRGLLIRALGRNVYRRRLRLENRKNYVQQHVASDDPTTCWYHDLVPGGLSNYWTGAVPRFAPEDFREGERLHERYRWPISYEDLAPYYRQAERRLEVVGEARNTPSLPAPLVTHGRRLRGEWRNVARHAEHFGQGLVPLPLADGPPWLIARSGVAFNSFTKIVEKLRRYPHFQLLLGAHALRLEWSGATQRVNAVLYYDRGAACERRVAGAAVVVACGALSSTKLLLASACSDFPDGLGDTEGLLGRYLHDHAQDLSGIELDTPLPRLGHAAYLTRAPYAESSPLLAASCTVGNRSASPVEKLLTFTPLKSTAFGVVVFSSMVPLERNRVSLHAGAKDEFGLPMLDVHIHYDSEVLTNVVAARERLRAILESAGYRCTVKPALKGLTPGNSVHYGGTIRMHSSPRYGMLNGWNRLHAVDNVVVGDASCFTTGVEKNPTLSVMAIATRAAHRLAVDLKGGDQPPRPQAAALVFPR